MWACPRRIRSPACATAVKPATRVPSQSKNAPTAGPGRARRDLAQGVRGGRHRHHHGPRPSRGRTSGGGGLQFVFVGPLVAAQRDRGRGHRGHRDARGRRRCGLTTRCSPSTTSPSSTATTGSSTSIAGTEACSDPAWKADCCSRVAITPTTISSVEHRRGEQPQHAALGDDVRHDLGEHRHHAEQHADADRQQ